VCDLENLKNEEAMTRVGPQHKKRSKAKLQLPSFYTWCSTWILILFLISWHIPSSVFVVVVVVVVIIVTTTTSYITHTDK